MNRKPFLKWAGRKYRLLGRILGELPHGRRFVEPFAGSAAVYLNAPFEQALVCDVNTDLVELFQVLQAEGEPFIDYCRGYFTPATNTREAYGAFRDQFNSTREPRLRSALFLYLNRHSFNGLVRYNSQGGFNVPFGRYKRPYFPYNELKHFYLKTRATKTVFAARDFRAVFAELRKGDVVYCDPPYVPLSNTASFTSYSGKNFGEAEQKELAMLAAAAWKRGIPVILSNHDTEITRLLYSNADITRFSVQRLISCNGQHRDSAPELLAVYR